MNGSNNLREDRYQRIDIILCTLVGASICHTETNGMLTRVDYAYLQRIR